MHEGEHDIIPWMTYFWGVILRAYKDFERRVGTFTTGKGSKALHIKKTIENMVGPFAISDIEKVCPSVSRDTVRLVLRQLRDKGALLPEGKGRGAKWVRKL